MTAMLLPDGWRRRNPPPRALCVASTSRPPPASRGSAECSVALCPRTGSIFPSSGPKIGGGAGGGGGGRGRGRAAGVASLALFPSSVVVGGGGGGSGVGDVFLACCGEDGGGPDTASLSVGGAASPRWKCKLPEPMGGGLIFSRCGRYVFGGGGSGRCYAWSALSPPSPGGRGGGGGGGRAGAELLRVWDAHCRPVTCLSLTTCGGFLFTGGMDGVVNAWSLLDMLCLEGGGGGGASGRDSIQPARTYSDHHLPVTSLHPLPSGRVLSGSRDRQLAVLELCSGATLARILLPASIAVVSADACGRRAYCGGGDGVIYCVDLDAYAMGCTAEGAGAVITGGGGGRGSGIDADEGWDPLETVLGAPSLGSKPGGGAAAAAPNYLSEMRGHSPGSVTALAVVEDGEGEGTLVSGGDDGAVRVWDVRSRSCVRIVRPWGGGSSAAPSAACPVSSIVVVSSEGGAAHGKASGQGFDISSLMGPLQRFPRSPEDDGGEIGIVPVLRARRDRESVEWWERAPSLERRAKRVRGAGPAVAQASACASSPKETGEGSGGDKEDDAIESDEDGGDEGLGGNAAAEEEVARLRKELEEAKKTIERWEKVNNKLAKKLKKAPAAKIIT